MSERFNIRYESGDLPWEINRPDFNLKNTVSEYSISPEKALDIGCGTGDNVIWLAQQGFNVSGIDISQKAVVVAKGKIKDNGLNVPIHNIDFMQDEVPGHPFRFVFDRGCFHSFKEKDERALFAKNVYNLLDKNGMWLSLIGSYDDGRLETGPPKHKASEIIEAVEPFFEIIFLKAGLFDSNDEIPSKIWICLMKKR